MSLPQRVTEFLQRLVVTQRSPAYVQIGPDGAVVSAGGALERYGLEPDDLRPMTQRLPFLSGVLPLSEAVFVPRLSWEGSLATDVHAFPDGESSWLVLLDASAAVDERQAQQQAAHEHSLRRERAELDLGTLQVALAGLDIVICALGEEGRFRVVGRPPEWFARFMPDVSLEESFDLGARSPFLASFLDEAAEQWAAPGAAAQHRSGPWVEADASGAEQALEAIALTGGGRPLVAIERLGAEFEQQRVQLQATRQIQLLHERLQREVAQRDVLIHCIVHDLMGPLTSMRGCLDLLLEGEVEGDVQTELLELGLTAATGQERMIREILEAFQAETDQLQAFETDAATAPDLVASARRVLDSLRPAYLQAGSRLELETGLERTPVHGEQSRLERVLSNLLENALRYSPAGGLVTVGIADEGEVVRVTVDDEGPGMSAEQRQDLFQKFAKGKQGGKAGLGLYFCRITVERWGGQIGSEPRTERGTRFWFQLPHATSGAKPRAKAQ